MSKTSVKKLTYFLLILAVILLLIVVIIDGLKQSESISFTGYGMGSQISGTIYGTNDKALGEKVVSVIKEEEALNLSKYKETSEIYKLNSDGSLELSDSTAEIISNALEISKDSDGAFDITVGRLSSLWNFDNYTQSIPDENAINEALLSCDYSRITKNGNRFTLGGGQQIDLGAVGKGVACDDALEVLEAEGVDAAVLSVGGTILTYGENPEGDYWTVGIRSPEKDKTDVFMKLKIKGTAVVSTSGSYEKYFEKDGKLYHHILSTETGYPSENSLVSVTIIANSGLVADALSTACFVLGMEKSCALLEKYNADAVFVDSENNVYITENYFDKYEVNDGFRCYAYEECEEYTAFQAE